MKKLYLYFLIIVTGLMHNSCEQEEDYSDRAFRNYLGYEIEKAGLHLAETVEGTEEGQYNAGSQSTYNKVLIDAKTVFDNVKSSQKSIDEFYKAVKASGETYFDEMVPYTSVLIDKLEQANLLLDSTEEGTDEGNVAVGSKDPFQNAVNTAQSYLDNGGYTQRDLNQKLIDFIIAIFAYESNIIGAYNILIENASFEEPGIETTDFTMIPAWSFQGKRFSWAATRAGTVQVGNWSLPTTTDGEFAIVIGNYTKGISQQLKEEVHPGSTYTLSFDGSLRSSSKDWQGIFYETHILSRLIVFNTTEGDFDDITIIDQKSSSLGSEENLDDFTSYSHKYLIPQDPSLLGKKMVIQFRTYEEGFDYEQEVWSDSESSEVWAQTWVYIDNISLKRE